MAVSGVDAKTANYTFALSDAGKMLTMSNTSARTFTIPLDLLVNFPVGTIIYVTNINTGAVTIEGSIGVTVNALGGLRVLNGAHSAGMCVKVAAGSWFFTVMTRGLG
jgi:hypothetical protein